MKTMICLILDRSGSMHGREADVIGGVNKFLAEQKALPDPASIALVRFDDQAVERFREMGPLADCADLTHADYCPRGMTPLLDAIGKTVAALDEDWKREEPERAIVVIVTDGAENDSKEFRRDQIKSLIQAREASGKWSFIYLGANVDAFAEAQAIGVQLANAAGYQNTSKGTGAMYAAVGSAVRGMRASGQSLAPNLGREIGEDETEPTQTGVTWTPPT